MNANEKTLNKENEKLRKENEKLSKEVERLKAQAAKLKNATPAVESKSRKRAKNTVQEESSPERSDLESLNPTRTQRSLAAKLITKDAHFECAVDTNRAPTKLQRNVNRIDETENRMDGASTGFEDYHYMPRPPSNYQDPRYAGQHSHLSGQNSSPYMHSMQMMPGFVPRSASRLDPFNVARRESPMIERGMGEQFMYRGGPSQRTGRPGMAEHEQAYYHDNLYYHG